MRMRLSQIIVALVLNASIFSTISLAAIRYVGPGQTYTTIQSAVNAATNGDIIIVKDGTYTENVNVNKQLTIQSENGYGSTIVIAAISTDHVFDVTAQNTTIQGFTIYGATSTYKYGVYVNEVDNCTITENHCGYDASHKNYQGICSSYSNTSTISNNICNSNSSSGIYVAYSTNSTISGNTCNYNGDYGGIIIDGNGNIVSNNTCNYNSYAGIYSFYNNSEISDNICEFNTEYGMRIQGGTNKIRGNSVQQNSYFGIYITDSANPDLGTNSSSDKGRNTIKSNGIYELYNFTSNTISAYLNYWAYAGTDPTVIDSYIYDDEEDASKGQVLFDPWITSDQALPVELTLFSANVVNGKTVLSWTTATEINNYGFEILRFDQNDKWEKIGFVQGHRNSNSPKDYSFTDSPQGGAKFKYRLKQIDFDGTFEYSYEVEFVLEMPASFSLEQNYPNPFNPGTLIKYSIPNVEMLHATSLRVMLKIYDVLGREVATLINEERAAGNYEVKFDGSRLPSGIYFYRLTAGYYVQTRKMILMK